ncbi:MAG: serine/threonine protein kinase [Planctomycetota bacterium]|nr:MAG: serine/threonine protein kinase [Planctomycetota bacterium]
MNEATPDVSPLASSREGEPQAPFGQVLIDRGLAEPHEVELAIQLQSQLAARGVFMRLGELLVARGVIDEDTVAEVLRLQGTRILVCPRCLAQYNILVFRRSKSYRCSRCQSELSEPQQLREVWVEDTLVASELDLDALDFSAGGHEFGNYVILGQIARGGMGLIYKARQKDLDRIVAMKVMTQAEARGETARQEFTKEARAVAQLRHPYIVGIYEVGRLGGVDYYTMDYVEGLPLQRAVTSEGLQQRELAELFVKVCDAVDYAHSQGILHHDVKPQNILVDAKRNPVLIDFGISNKLDEDEDAGRIVGSPAYLPPEYLCGEGPYDVVGEVYALGATFYTVLAGRPPHDGIDTRRLLRSASYEPVVPLRSLRRSVDPGLARIVMTALQRDRRRRYPTAHALAADLRRWLEGDEVLAGQGPLGRAWSRLRGRVAASFGLVLALLLVSVTLSYQLALSQQKRNERGLEAQFARERRELTLRFVRARLETARLLLELGRCAEAEEALDRLLLSKSHEALPSPLRREIHQLRARARELLGDTAGAGADRRAALPQSR